jgi:hypothetical protein
MSPDYMPKNTANTATTQGTFMTLGCSIFFDQRWPFQEQWLLWPLLFLDIAFFGYCIFCGCCKNSGHCSHCHTWLLHFFLLKMAVARMAASVAIVYFLLKAAVERTLAAAANAFFGY